MLRKPNYIFNHFIPKFILNRFANEYYSGSEKLHKVWVYDIEKNMIESPETKRALGEYKLYWDETQKDKSKLERDLNSKLEQRFLNIISKRVYDAKGRIELSRFDLQEIKRYILAQMIRTPADEHYETFFGGKQGKLVLEQFGEMLRLQGRKKPLKDLTGLSNKEAMLHDLRIVVDAPFEEIFDHEDATPRLANYASFINSSYLGFWLADKSNDFVLTDTYLINERDPMIPYKLPNGKAGLMHTRAIIVHELLEKYRKQNEIKPTQAYAELNNLFVQMFNCHEAVWFFPIAPSMSIVLINPFFKALQYNEILHENLDYVIRSGIFTNIDLQYFTPNIAEYKRQDEINAALIKGDIVSASQFYSDDDKYIYPILQLDAGTTQYVNMLMLDRVTNLLIFKNKARMTPSVRFYLDFDANNKLVDYLPLYRKLKDLD